MSDVRRTEGQPHDRLTRICDKMTQTFDLHPEHHEDDKCMVFLDDGHRGGLVIHGYEDEISAMADLLMHLKAMFKAAGKDMDIVFLGNEGVDRV